MPAIRPPLKLFPFRIKGIRVYFIDLDGNRASIASRVAGVLAAVANTDFPDPPDEFSGRIAIYTGGRFLWSAVRMANPAFVFD